MDNNVAHFHAQQNNNVVGGTVPEKPFQTKHSFLVHHHQHTIMQILVLYYFTVDVYIHLDIKLYLCY